MVNNVIWGKGGTPILRPMFAALELDAYLPWNTPVLLAHLA